MQLASCSKRRTVTKYIYLSIVLKYTFWVSVLWVLFFFLETYDFNFTTFERQIFYFSLHYISVKVFEVESCYYVAASVGDFFSSLKCDFLFPDSLSVITLVGLHEVISQHFLNTDQ